MICAFELIPRARYSFDLTAARFGRFASEIVYLPDGKQYRRLLTAGRQLALATVTDVGTVDKPRRAVELRSPSKAPLQWVDENGSSHTYPHHEPVVLRQTVQFLPLHRRDQRHPRETPDEIRNR